VTNRISVVTPSFNQGVFIERTIKSVLQQKGCEIEYIIIDGASKDNSIEVIKKFSHHLAYWVSETDHGQTEAINKGLSRITGDIWAYICSDDTYTPEAFTDCLELFRDKSVDVVFGNCNFINLDDRVTRLKKPGEFDRRKLLRANYIYQPSVFLRRWILDEFGFFDPSLKYAMDYEYWLRISRRARFKYLDRVLSNYRLHVSSKSIAQVIQQIEEATSVKKRYGAGLSADLTNFAFKHWGKTYYKTKRHLFESLTRWRT
jgi:glycosyltransferase involved in cell wall biosynthesis